MKFGVGLPQAGRLATPQSVTTLARAAEEIGFDSVWLGDHVITPEGLNYVPENFLEAFAVMSHVGAVTSYVRIGVSVLVVPFRDPLYTAKYLGSLDVLSEGRISLAVGTGWVEEEVEALGTPFVERGKRTDEALRVIRNLWETETSTFHGNWKNYDNMRMFPKHSAHRRGPIPILVGGQGKVALRRAAELGDGWHPVNMTIDDLREGIAAYHEQCARFGRAPGQVVVRHQPGGGIKAQGGEEPNRRPEGYYEADPRRAPLTGTVDEIVEDIRDYEKLGVSEVILGEFGRNLDAQLDLWRHFARHVIPRM